MENFDYFAFISYKREDEKWAKWLQNKIESYHIPSVVRKDVPRLPKRVRPIFRDKTDLGAGALTESLHAELERSKYLIVICSPASAKSEWVGKEVKHFIALGREKQIIPFIVDGTPHALNPKDECFNPIFSSFVDEPLGVNIQEIGKKQALVKIVARLLDLKFDKLWGRFQRRERMKRMWAYLISALLVLLSIFVWDCTRSRYEYYADYVDCYGVPKGVIELSKSEVTHRNRMYRFCYKRQLNWTHFRQWRLSEVDYVNSVGSIMNITNSELMNRFPIQRLHYGESGTLVSTEFCNRNGKTLIRYDYSTRNGVPTAIADFKSAVEGLGESYLGASTISSSINYMGITNKTNIIRYAYQRDMNGFITRMTYHANNAYDLRSSAVYDADGVAGVVYQRDSLGRVLEMRYIDADYNYSRTKKGIAGRRYEYNQRGNILKTTYFDINDSPILNENGWAIRIDVSDEYGNIIETTFHNSNGELYLCKNGFAKCISKYDKHGNETEYSFYGTDGNPCMINDGCAKCIAKYDEYGYRTELLFYNTGGNPCMTNVGVAKCITKYDRHGNEIECSFYDTEGNPCLHLEGQASWRARYDEHGNEIECSYYGTDGNPCLTVYGYAKWMSKYDEHGNEIECSFYGIDGTSSVDNNGIAKLIAAYDERGNRIGLSYYGCDGNPCLHKKGNASWRAQYDERGNVVEWSYYDTDGNPCLIDEGYAKWIAQYDEHGNETERSFYGTDGNPCLIDEGYASWRVQYDEHGNGIECSFYGTDGNPCLIDVGCAKWLSKYDEHGNEIECSFYGTDGNPCLIVGGYAKWISKYDEHGNETERSFYGTDGNPCLIVGGYAKRISKYDERGIRIECSFYGTDGNLCLIDEGYAKWMSKYDEHGNEIECSFYGIDGTVVRPKTSDGEDKLSSPTCKTRCVVSVSGIALKEKVEVGSIIIKLNTWVIGDDYETLDNLLVSRNIKKTFVMITPSGEIKKYTVDGGVFGINTATQAIEVSLIEGLKSLVNLEEL